MRLQAIKLHNFRGYGEEVAVELSDFTAIIGRNDVGKSSILEALEIFFNHEIVKIENGDQCVHTPPGLISISCVFDDLPSEIVIDARSRTTLTAEFLTNSDGRLEIVKRFDCSTKTPKETVLAQANHPSANGVGDLLKLKNAQLKERAGELACPLNGVDQRSNVALRAAIRAHVGELGLTPTLVPLGEEDGKKIWELIEKALPVYALFQADRPSKDDDPEVSDPMKIAVQNAVREVEQELDRIKQVVQEKALAVAQRTLSKLAEMDPTLAAELTPTFKSEPKWDGFKLSLTGDNGIPINKRGSGVRRLILLNFFRAETERRREAAAAHDVIFAIEEPESSQHPDNQTMLIKALLALSAEVNTQVLVTTHVPSVAAQIPSESVRLIVRNERGFPSVEAGAEDVYERATETLGLLPDKRAQLAIFVEGPNDVEFLQRASRIYRAHDASLLDLDADHRIAFVVTGGGNLKHWVNKRYLANAGLIEVHIYDRDDQVNPPYQAHVDAVNGRGDQCVAYLTNKREIENYIHEDAIHAALNHLLVLNDWSDVPSVVASAIHNSSGAPLPWAQLTIDKQKEKASRAKRKLCCDVMDCVTFEQLVNKDAANEVRTWLEAVRDRVRP